MVLNGVTAGNLLVAVLTQETDATLFATNSDGTNTWIKNEEQADSTRGNCCIQSAQNVAGGNTTVTVTLAGGVSKTYRGKLIEVSGSVTTGMDVGDKVSVDAAGTTHHCSAAGITPSGPCIIFTSSIAASNLGGTTPGAGYTALTTAGNFTNWQYQIFSSAPTSERGAWSSVNAPNSNGAIAAFKAAAGAAFTPWGNLANWSDMVDAGADRILAY